MLHCKYCLQWVIYTGSAYNKEFLNWHCKIDTGHPYIVLDYVLPSPSVSFYVSGTGDYRARALYRLGLAMWILIGLAYISSLISMAQDTAQDMANKVDAKTDKDEEKADTEKVGQGREKVDRYMENVDLD